MQGDISIGLSRICESDNDVRERGQGKLPSKRETSTGHMHGPDGFVLLGLEGLPCFTLGQ